MWHCRPTSSTPRTHPCYLFIWIWLGIYHILWIFSYFSVISLEPVPIWQGKGAFHSSVFACQRSRFPAFYCGCSGMLTSRFKPWGQSNTLCIALSFILAVPLALIPSPFIFYHLFPPTHLIVSQKLSNASLCVVCSSFPTLSFISVPGFPLLLFLVYLLPGHRLWSSQTTLNLSTITGDLLTVWCLVLSYLITANQESSVFSSIYPLHALSFSFSFTFRHFYPKSLSLHSRCTFKFFQFLLSLGIEPMTLRC